MLDSLPAELLRAIFAHVHNKRHLLTLSTVSKKFRTHIFPRLFEVLDIRSDEHSPWDFESCPLLAQAMIARVPNVLMAVKELRFSAPFENTDRHMKRCEHMFSPYSSASSSDPSRSDDNFHMSQEGDGAVTTKRKDPYQLGDAKYIDDLLYREYGDRGLVKLATKIVGLLAALPKDQLISFRWDMGTCFPYTLLGREGYLVTHQKCIRKLAITTEGGCNRGSPPLQSFTNLRELSWKVLPSHKDCISFKEFLDLHHERLTSLEVDLIDWEEVVDRFDLPDDDDDNHDEGSPTPLTDLILPKRTDEYKGFLPNLQVLSLSAASFQGSLDRLLNAFNLCSVKELRLRACDFTVDLLKYMARTNVSLQATRVELVLDDTGFPLAQHDSLDFLAPFNDLEDLFLMINVEYAYSCYTEMILRHQKTLRRLIHHGRNYCLNDESPYDQEYCDISLEEVPTGSFANILPGTKLESAGVCAEPSTLQGSFHGIASRVGSLKILHLRSTGKAERKPKFHKDSEAYEHVQGGSWREDEQKELEAFADWAFGPDGFPRLQVLASGDFSYGKCFADTQTLWCRDTGSPRSDKTWRTVEESDVAENELIDANMDMLSACPVSPLFYRYGRGNVFPGIS